MTPTTNTSPTPSVRTTRLLTVLVVLQALTLAAQWVGLPSATTPAIAQVPDAGAQRFQMIDELKGVNARLDKLITILESGKLEVRVANPPAR